MSKEHTLKCWLTYFEAIERGEKNFEVRRDDRGFQKGDVLILLCYNERAGMYMKRRDGQIAEVRRRISYILTGGQFGIQPRYVVMGLEPADAPGARPDAIGIEQPQQEAAE